MDYEEIILSMSSAYDKKFYLNDEFDELPQIIKDQIKIISVLYTEDVGGILTMKFDEEGNLLLESTADEEDLLYDEIGAHLKIKRLMSEERELLESLETFFKVFYLEG